MTLKTLKVCLADCGESESQDRFGRGRNGRMVRATFCRDYIRVVEIELLIVSNADEPLDVILVPGECLRSHLSETSRLIV